MPNLPLENVVIIGGGPAGLAAALYTARANLKSLVFAGSPPGGQLTLTSDVENYPGFESILGPELIERMRKQTEKFGTRIFDENVLSVDFSQKPLKVTVSESAYKKVVKDAGELSTYQISAKTIIIATGAEALWLGLESEQRLRGRGVSACATCDGFFFRNKVVAVVGGGDTALEEALTLTKFASKVYLVHRRDSFRASKIMQERVLNHSKIEVIYNAEVEEVLGEQKVEGIKLQISNYKYQMSNEKNKNNSDIGNLKFEIRNLKVDGLFIAIGHKPDTDIFANQILLDEKGYVMTSDRFAYEFAKSKVLAKGQSSSGRKSQNLETINLGDTFNFTYPTATSVPGVFAGGDCVDYIYRQAATAAGMGVAAALDVEKYLESIN